MPQRRTRYLYVAATIVVGAVACGGQVATAPEGDVPPDADAQDASPLDVSVRPAMDSSATLDVATSDAATWGDASPWTDAAAVSNDATAPDDATSNDGGPEVDAPAGDGAPKLDASADAGADAGADCIDMCTVGDTQCNVYAVESDGGPFTTSLVSNLSTCVLGSSGCTVWGSPTACSAGIACCSCYIAYCGDSGVASHDACIFCPAAPVGTPCMQDSDCGTDACDAISLTCVSNRCHDSRQDGAETDDDCGGGGCPACNVGQRCETNFDCESGHFCALPAHVCQ
jgi:hypothetical protein